MRASSGIRVAAQTARISGAVPTLVVGEHARRELGIERVERRQDRRRRGEDAWRSRAARPRVSVASSCTMSNSASWILPMS